ncbi:MAG: hypothetical protein WBL87_08140 [Methanothrix sp.]
MRVLRPDKDRGTGFVVAEDLAVSCAHIIALAAQPKEGRAGTDDTALSLKSGAAHCSIFLIGSRHSSECAALFCPLPARRGCIAPKAI